MTVTTKNMKFSELSSNQQVGLVSFFAMFILMPIAFGLLPGLAILSAIVFIMCCIEENKK